MTRTTLQAPYNRRIMRSRYSNAAITSTGNVEVTEGTLQNGAPPAGTKHLTLKVNDRMMGTVSYVDITARTVARTAEGKTQHTASGNNTNSLSMFTTEVSANVPVNHTIKVTASPKGGYRFVRWEGNVDGLAGIGKVIQLKITHNTELRAVFERESQGTSGSGSSGSGSSGSGSSGSATGGSGSSGSGTNGSGTGTGTGGYNPERPKLQLTCKASRGMIVGDGLDDESAPNATTRLYTVTANAGDTVKFSAIAAEGYHFIKWDVRQGQSMFAGLNVNNPSLTVRMTGYACAEAIFHPDAPDPNDPNDPYDPDEPVPPVTPGNGGGGGSEGSVVDRVVSLAIKWWWLLLAILAAWWLSREEGKP